MQHRCLVWAHRGASGYAPENTLEAFQLAVDMGADGVELDVHLTKDGELAVAHDERLERVSNGTGFLKDYTLNELKQLHFCKTHPEYADARLPSLQEVYELLLHTGLTVNVELKTNVFSYDGIEQKLLKLAQKMGMENRVLYSSFQHSSLINLRKLDPSVKIGLLYSGGLPDAPAYGEHMKANALHPEKGLVLQPGYLENCYLKGLKVHPWTVNSEADLKQMISLGVDAVITNFPDRAKKLVSTKR